MTNINDFISELEALCKRHKASIGGCECCGVPWVEVDGQMAFDVAFNFAEETSVEAMPPTEESRP